MADNRPPKGFARDTSRKGDLPPSLTVAAAPQPQPTQPLTAAGGRSTPADLATGRDSRYEWEVFLAEVFGRLAALEAGGGVGGGGATITHVQAAPAATWSIAHYLATKPAVTVVETAGGLVLTEVAYPDDNTAVVTFASPTAGTAYLRG